MNNKKCTAMFGLLISINLAFSGSVLATSLSDMAKACDECHGSKGNSTDDKVPSIAGFSESSLVDMMEQYKAGDRPADKYKPSGGEETDMQVIAKDMSDEDISAISAHYAKQTFKPIKQDFDAAAAKRGAEVHDKLCEKCHSEGGANADDDAAILAGQWRGYLERQFVLITSGERETTKKMKKKMKKVKDEDIQPLIEFYISKQ
ncbi:MAG: c-type cytochrome [Candidatus Thiodiazotropha taylori]|nr:c-type cytochrome [Candidatus Thiodiazotropha taylori]MCG8050490.1 c-type cytochrome [Candidatus Thiodiazotropha taylori]MCW4312309.1 c-type cytochrome [Candidatus Thiodiazotropha taylori]MCW4322762.1 c-type cytochrome [Candidatus Thiodiazotropha taylori]